MIRERDEKRISWQQTIMCRYGNKMHPGFTSDVSQHGMGINSLPRLPLDHKSSLRISLAAGKQQISLQGRVRWLHEEPECPADGLQEVGLFIENPPAAYLQFVADCNGGGTFAVDHPS